MQNNPTIQPATTNPSFLTGSSSGLPPTSFGEMVLNELFGDDDNSFELLAPFDYEAFLRREGLA